jgi:NAD(P)-dependent dehydrogenase (short-subunit alcohol dehydrogenase family)
MSGYLELEDKRALVTGGTKGVGAAVVAALREAGARVLTTARNPPEDVSEAEFVAADVSTAQRCAALGGTNEPSNCVVVCWSCHYSVHEGGNYRFGSVSGALKDFPYFGGSA